MVNNNKFQGRLLFVFFVDMEETGFIVRLYVEHFTARKKMWLCLIIAFLVQIHELPAMPRKLNSL